MGRSKNMMDLLKFCAKGGQERIILAIETQTCPADGAEKFDEYALIAQGIEQEFPKLCAQVQVLVGANYRSKF
jgi:hypothetical protein